MPVPLRDKSKPKRPSRYARPFRVDTDPRVTTTDPCVVCGKSRGKIPTEHDDPFCGRACCESHYSKGE